KMILTGGDDGAQLWDAETGKFLCRLDQSGKVWSVAFGPSDQLALTTRNDGSAQLWDTKTGKRHGSPMTHRGAVFSGVFSPDGQLILTVSADHTARLWDIGTGRTVGPVLTHEDQVSCAAFSPDGGKFATGSQDRTACIWNTPLPVQGERPQVMLWTQVLTGMELDSNGVVRPLDAVSWQKYRQQFQSS